jgi:hypothetical protein
MRSATWILAGLLGLGMTISSPPEAQRFPGVGGIEGRVGVVLPDDANTGLAAAVDLDLGYVAIPHLRAVVGLD